MKKIFTLIVFTITLSLSVKAEEYIIKDYFDKASKEELKQMGVYFGNPKENKIVAQGDMYLIIHNPTELSFIVMDQEAKDYCKKKSSKYNYTSYFMRMLGRYTAYFACEMENKIDQYSLSEEEKDCIVNRYSETQGCVNLNSKNAAIIKAIELQITNETKLKNRAFIHLLKTKYYNQIEEIEQTAHQKKTNYEERLSIDRNIKICKNYKFEEGSQLFGECILKLIERDNAITIENYTNIIKKFQ